MSSNESRPPTAAAEVDPTWYWLYRTGGVAAALLVVVTVLHSGVFSVVGLPETVSEWFGLFGRNPLGGLLAFELLMVVFVILSVPVALALYVALRQAAPSLMAIYLGLTLIAVMAFVAARPAFEMLSLSDGYAAATTDSQRSTYLAAGEATLAVFHGTAFWVSYVLGSFSGLLLAAAMLRSGVFSRTTAYLRIASSVLDLGLFIPTVGLAISLGSVLCLTVFNVLIARRLWQLGRAEPDAGRPSRPAVEHPLAASR
jgi:hypothetical protein